MGALSSCDLCGAATQLVDLVVEDGPGRPPRTVHFTRCTSLLCSSNLSDDSELDLDGGLR